MNRILLIGIVLIFVLCFNNKGYAQNDSTNNDISVSANNKQAISLGISDILDIGYRKSITKNWFWSIHSILSHTYTNGQIHIATSSDKYDNVSENEYTFGLKLLAIYNKTIYKPISINLGGGITYLQDGLIHQLRDVETQKFHKDYFIETSYGFTFLIGLEVGVYKGFNIIAQHNIFAGYRHYTNDSGHIKNDYLLQLENLSVGAIIYF